MPVLLAGATAWAALSAPHEMQLQREAKACWYERVPDAPAESAIYCGARAQANTPLFIRFLNPSDYR